MSILYLVTESSNDALFYTLCAMRFTGLALLPTQMKNRKGDGEAAVRTQIKYALRQARAAAQGDEPVFFIVAIDNDRSPHPENEARPPDGTGLERSRLSAQEQKRRARLEFINSVIASTLGANHAASRLAVAVAVPVEMIEGWIVRAQREHPPQPTPHFSSSAQLKCREYYGPSDPPSQWKDLEAEERGAMSRAEFYEKVVRDLDVDALAARSLSFRMFKEQLDAWPRSAALQS